MVALQRALERADSATEQAEAAFAVIDKALSPESPLLYKLDRALDELTAAVRSLRMTADYLQQNPQLGNLRQEGLWPTMTSPARVAQRHQLDRLDLDRAALESLLNRCMRQRD